MLGWEFPPFIAGGLGVACFGLTKALDKAGHHVIFILPKPVDRSRSSHVRMLSPEAMHTQASQDADRGAAYPSSGSSTHTSPIGSAQQEMYGFQHATFRGVHAAFSSPYPSFNAGTRFVPLSGDLPAPAGSGAGSVAGFGHSGTGDVNTGADPAHSSGLFADGGGYGDDLIGDCERYARLVVSLTRRENFDVIHAHDWLTYPAGIALAKVSGKPLVVHVHSTEFDRAGSNVNQRVYDIERAGMHAADRVIAVSQFTKSICVRRYGARPDRIDVVYNGVEREQQPLPGAAIQKQDRIVLFLGRITMQKGPEYFIAAAKRVIEKVQDVKFVLAGSGDMALRMIELAASMGIGHKVLFTGFLRGRDVERVFKMADCYVMPSVSEPFGIAALEAISHDVPVILSKTSGASEVLQHVLKVDFWDVDEMANKIVAVLKYPPLSQTLREHGELELHRLTWEGAAERCLTSYNSAAAARSQPNTGA